MPDRNELSNLNLNEFSICFEALGGPANEDCSIEFVKSKAGLGPVLKETDMSEHNDDHIDNEVDEDFGAFADSDDAKEFLTEFSELSDDEQVGTLLGMAYDGMIQEAAIGDAAEVIKSLTENSVPREQHEAVLKTLKDAGAVIEKMKNGGKVAEDDDTLSRITKSLGGEGSIPDDVRATITDLVKAKEDGELRDEITKAKAFGFGDATKVAPLLMRIRKGKTTAEDAAAVEAMLKQAGAIVKGSDKFKVIGEDVGADAGDPIAKAKGVIAEIKKAHPTLSEQQLFAKAIEQNPGLYRELEAARQAA